MNDLSNEINFDKIARFQGESRRKNKLKGYETSQIRTILANCDLRLRVAILTLASTGMRIGALVELKLSHIENKQTRVGEVYKFTVYENLSVFVVLNALK
jgi:integrase